MAAIKVRSLRRSTPRDTQVIRWRPAPVTVSGEKMEVEADEEKVLAFPPPDEDEGGPSGAPAFAGVLPTPENGLNPADQPATIRDPDCEPQPYPIVKLRRDG
ncbi:MAG: hypothetical protein AAGB11_09060 [Pseudomonadota bacterium]